MDEIAILAERPSDAHLEELVNKMAAALPSICVLLECSLTFCIMDETSKKCQMHTVHMTPQGNTWDKK